MGLTDPGAAGVTPAEWVDRSGRTELPFYALVGRSGRICVDGQGLLAVWRNHGRAVDAAEGVPGGRLVELFTPGGPHDPVVMLARVQARRAVRRGRP